MKLLPLAKIHLDKPPIGPYLSFLEAINYKNVL
jgi:hypothetical protein